jgi:ATP-binding cassette subfamily F protein uup
VTLLGVRGVVKAYGTSTILDGVDVSFAENERVGLVGLNGSGKSTLARILGGIEIPDAGTLAKRRGADIRYLAQEPVFEPGQTAREVVTAGLSAWAKAKDLYDQASADLSEGRGDVDALLEQQTEAAADVERLGGWDRSHEVDSLLGHLSVRDPDAVLDTLSGGEKRRVALAQLLVARPHLAILDEPTNHLDVETIQWLEEYLEDEYEGALLLVTHDRYLLDRVATRTLELDRGKIYDYDGGYEQYLERKAERQMHEARTESNRQNFLRTELEWLRRQPKARSTKQKARIERAENAKGAAPPPKERTATFSLDEVRSGKTILETRDLSIAAGGNVLVQHMNLILTQGERIGIVGRNGTGKTTFLRTVLGEIPAAAGQVIMGVNTKVAYFDQSRSDLDPKKSIFENVVGDQPKIEVGGETMEPRAYLERFLFDPQKQRQPVGSLSGGERARVALARLLRQSANLLIFDEPTNDLDVATLGALEDLLVRFGGTSLVVTHDRWFLDRVATSILHLAGDGTATKYAGAYDAFQRARQDAAYRKKEEELAAKESAKAVKEVVKAAKPRTVLTSAEKTELAAIMDRIEAAEEGVAHLEAMLADPDVYADAERVKGLLVDLDGAKTKAAALTTRWEELEAKKGALTLLVAGRRLRRSACSRGSERVLAAARRRRRDGGGGAVERPAFCPARAANWPPAPADPPSPDEPPSPPAHVGPPSPAKPPFPLPPSPRGSAPAAPPLVQVSPPAPE